MTTVVLDEVDLLQPPGSLEGLEPVDVSARRRGRGPPARGGRATPGRGLARGRGLGRGPARGRGGVTSLYDSIERRMGQKRPTQVFVALVV